MGNIRIAVKDHNGKQVFVLAKIARDFEVGEYILEDFGNKAKILEKKVDGAMVFFVVDHKPYDAEYHGDNLVAIGNVDYIDIPVLNAKGERVLVPAKYAINFEVGEYVLEDYANDSKILEKNVDGGVVKFVVAHDPYFTEIYGDHCHDLEFHSNDLVAVGQRSSC